VRNKFLAFNIHKVTIILSLLFANCANATTRNSLSFKSTYFSEQGIPFLKKGCIWRNFFISLALLISYSY